MLDTKTEAATKLFGSKNGLSFRYPWEALEDMIKLS